MILCSLMALVELNVSPMAQQKIELPISDAIDAGVYFIPVPTNPDEFTSTEVVKKGLSPEDFEQFSRAMVRRKYLYELGKDGPSALLEDRCPPTTVLKLIWGQRSIADRFKDLKVTVRNDGRVAYEFQSSTSMEMGSRTVGYGRLIRDLGGKFVYDPIGDVEKPENNPFLRWLKHRNDPIVYVAGGDSGGGTYDPAFREKWDKDVAEKRRQEANSAAAAAEKLRLEALAKADKAKAEEKAEAERQARAAAAYSDSLRAISENPNDCNAATKKAAENNGSKVPDGQNANDTIDKMNADKDNYQRVSPAQAQQAANDGKFVVAGQQGSSHGHLGAVVPGPLTTAHKRDYPQVASGSLGTDNPTGGGFSVGRPANTVFGGQRGDIVAPGNEIGYWIPKVQKR